MSDRGYLPTELAWLCVSAVLAVGRFPSVRLSVTVVCCIETAEDIDNLFTCPDSPIILVFEPIR